MRIFSVSRSFQGNAVKSLNCQLSFEDVEIISFALSNCSKKHPNVVVESAKDSLILQLEKLKS